MRGFGGLQSFYYLQLLLAGDTETGRKTRTISYPKTVSTHFMRRQTLTFILLVFIKIGLSQESNIENFPSKRTTELDFKDWSYVSSMLFNPADSLLQVEPIDYLRFLSTFKYDIKDSLLEQLEKHVTILPPTILWKYTINNKWIKKEDIDTLIMFVHSKQPAHIPWPMISSMIPYENTTVGIEAMHLINLYRNEKFHYPSLCSTYYFCKPENQDILADEYVEWWKLNKNK